MKEGGRDGGGGKGRGERKGGTGWEWAKVGSSSSPGSATVWLWPAATRQEGILLRWPSSLESVTGRPQDDALHSPHPFSSTA